MLPPALRCSGGEFMGFHPADAQGDSPRTALVRAGSQPRRGFRGWPKKKQWMNVKNSMGLQAQIAPGSSLSQPSPSMFNEEAGFSLVPSLLWVKVEKKSPPVPWETGFLNPRIRWVPSRTIPKGRSNSGSLK